ncbi:MAG: hypothetical protein NTV03_01565 [Candidatus Nomurabacteria bacterium]|nr:hypothetical protein [Candidatus Nomurabacteria bacterium]
MEKIKKLKFHRFAFLPAIFLVFVLLFTTHVFAASTSTKTPGEIIDATCSKEDVNCILKISIKIKITRIGESLSNTSDNLSFGWSTFTNVLLDNSENGIHNDKELIITLGNVSLSTSSALASGWSTFTNQLLDNSENSLSSHKQFADNLKDNLTRGTLAYTNTVLNIPDQTTKVFSSTKDLGLATTASVGDSLLGASNGIQSGWGVFINGIIDNSENTFSSYKQFADNLQNKITKGILAYTNGIINWNDHVTNTLASTLSNTIANTKNLGLATATRSLTASVGDSLLGTSEGISNGWGIFINGIINSAEKSATNTKKLATSLWSGIVSLPNGIISNWNSYLAILSEPKIITVPVILPPSLTTTSARQGLAENTPPVQPTSVTSIQKVYITDPRAKDYQSQQMAISELGRLLPRLQGVELALLNNINHNTNQTDRVYDSIIKSINS